MQEMVVSKKTPGWVRLAQIGLGAIIIILSIYALAFPKTAFISIVYILSIVLFFVGIEQIIVGIFVRSKSRWSSIGLGILILIFAGIAIAYPTGCLFGDCVYRSSPPIQRDCKIGRRFCPSRICWVESIAHRYRHIGNSSFHSSNGISSVWCRFRRCDNRDRPSDNWNIRDSFRNRRKETKTPKPL